MAAPTLLLAQVTDNLSLYLSAEVPASLLNLSVRSVLASDETLITGFTVSETSGATLLVRAAGPALSVFNVLGVMANPKLQIFDASGKLVAANDDWSAESVGPALGAIWSAQQTTQQAAQTAAQMVGAFQLPTSSRDAAVLVTLKPGGYTLVVSGSTSADVGTVLAEVYKLGAIETLEMFIARAGKPLSRMTNLSARGRMTANANGEGMMIGSFVVGGSNKPIASSPVSGVSLTPISSKRFLIRVVGPGLTPYGVKDAVSDPTLQLVQVSTSGLSFQTNDNWDTDPEAAKAAREAAASVGAFPLEPGSRDAVVIARLMEGSYSVIARGANGATGTVLIEVYELAD